MTACSCIASIHFISSAAAYGGMALIHFIQAILMISIAIVVTVIWIVYSSVFFWELFLASFLPGLFSIFNAALFIALSIAEVTRYRHRRRHNAYIPDKDIVMSARVEKFETAEKPSSKKNTTTTTNHNTSTDKISADDIELLPVDDSPKKKSEERAFVKVDPKFHVDWKRFLKHKELPATQKNYDEFVKMHETSSSSRSASSNESKMNSGRKIHPSVEIESEEDIDDNPSIDVLEDDNDAVKKKRRVSNVRYKESISRNPSKATIPRSSSVLHRKSTQSHIGRFGNVSMHANRSVPMDLNRSSSRIRKQGSRANLIKNNSRSNLTKSSSNLSRLSERGSGFLSSRDRYQEKISEKQNRRREYELQQAAGKDWTRFASKERQKGREPTWENFEKKQNKKHATVKKIGLIGKIASVLNNGIDAEEDQILKELSEKYNLPYKPIRDLHTRLAKKYGENMTRRDIKSSLNASHVSRKMLNSIIKMADDDNNGSVSVAEWMCLIFKFRYGKEKDRFASAFKIFDYDGSGSMERDEMYHMIAAFATDDVSKADKKALAVRMFNQMDAGNKGEVDLNTFVNYAQQDEELSTLITNMTSNLDLR